MDSKARCVEKQGVDASSRRAVCFLRVIFLLLDLQLGPYQHTDIKQYDMELHSAKPSLLTMSELPAGAKSSEAGRTHTASPWLVNSWIQFLIKSHPVITRVHCRWLGFVRKRKDKKGKRPPPHLPGVLTMYNIARWRRIKKGLLHLSFSIWIETYFPFSRKQASAV